MVVMVVTATGNVAGSMTGTLVATTTVRTVTIAMAGPESLPSLWTRNLRQDPCASRGVILGAPRPSRLISDCLVREAIPLSCIWDLDSRGGADVR